jgi:serine/threonine-protein kinase
MRLDDLLEAEDVPDLYSLGASLYFMVTGSVPFPNLSISETLIAHVARLPDPPSRLNPNVPEDLERVILRCLAKRPADRYESAQALEVALDRCRGADGWTAADARESWSRTVTIH